MGTSQGNDSDVVSSAPSVAGRMGVRKRAMSGDGELWKHIGAERRSQRQLDSFIQIVSEISRTSVAACQGGSFSLRFKT